MKGAILMDKKQAISWGVSFGSIALVAGMVSYLGLSKEYLPNTAKQKNTIQQTPNNFYSERGFHQDHDQDQSFDNSDDSQFNGDFFDNGQQSQQFDNSQQFSHGQHGNFDTTTGGT